MSSPTPKPRPTVPRAVPRPNAPVIDLSASRARAEAGPTSSGFNAVIEGASLADLVQLECMRGLTRAVKVKAQGQEGVLYFDQGQLAHATFGEMSGRDAAFHILSWETGTVEPSHHHWLHENTIDVSWQALLIAVAQRKDESARDLGDTHITSRPATEKVSPTLAVDDEFAEPELIRAVRLDSEGEVLFSSGHAQEFSDAVAYAVRLAQLIGEGLGLENLQGMECVTLNKTVLIYVEDDSFVALEAKAGADLSKYRKRSGT